MLKKRDFALIVLAVIIVAFLWAAPEESTSRVPYDDTHRPFFEMVKKEGKKAAEKHCETWHNAEGVPFPAEHPPKFRCLFCHKLEETPSS